VASVHEGKKPFKCEVCDYSCSQKSIMKSHVVSAHEGKKPFKCNICDYRCSRNINMNIHVTNCSAVIHQQDFFKIEDELIQVSLRQRSKNISKIKLQWLYFQTLSLE
jgi:hypothetical protein